MAIPLEIPLDRVEEFAQSARRKINAHLTEHECPEFWSIVAKMYACDLTGETSPHPAISRSSPGVQ